jgi:acid phosphatase family membrane protein YuiD
MNGSKQQIILFITNPVLLSMLFSWLVAQLIKTLIKLFSGKVGSLKELLELLFWRTGGMPSSHSALVVSLTTCIGFRSGINSDVFMLAAAFMFVTVRDALGVRRSSGIQANMINRLGHQLERKNIIEEYKPIKEVQGHKPAEVFIGCLLGFLIGVAFSVLK